MPILNTRPTAARRRMTPPREVSDADQDDSGQEVRSPKRPKTTAPTSGGSSSSSAPPPPPPPTLHAWLHPTARPPLIARSPPLHSSNSTFLAFSLSFEPPLGITSETTLAKEARRVVRELDIIDLVGDMLLESGEGAFQDGNGRAAGRKGKGKERAREPDCRMWAVRTLGLKERKDGTGGEDDYQLLETYNDDGEKFGGERVLRALKEGNAIDVITICCRWFGGDMIGPIRFQHIGLTSHTSITSVLKLVHLRDLRITLSGLDDEITTLRDILNPPGSPLLSVDATSEQPQSQSQSQSQSGGEAKYDGIVDPAKLDRLIKARQKTKAVLEGKATWVAMEQAKAEEAAAAAAAAAAAGMGQVQANDA